MPLRLPSKPAKSQRIPPRAILVLFTKPKFSWVGTVGRITLIKLLLPHRELWRALGHRYATRFSQANARLSLDFKLFLQWKYGLYPAQPPRRQEFALQNRRRWRDLDNDRTGLSRRANVFHQQHRRLYAFEFRRCCWLGIYRDQ